MDQYPVTDKPHKDVNHVEADGIQPEQHVGRQRRQGPRQHALWQRLQQDRVRNHRRPELDPTENFTNSFSIPEKKNAIFNLTF